MADVLWSSANIAGSFLFHIIERCFGRFLGFSCWVFLGLLTRRFSGVAMLTAISLALVLLRWTYRRLSQILRGLQPCLSTCAVHLVIPTTGGIDAALIVGGPWCVLLVCLRAFLGMSNCELRAARNVLRKLWRRPLPLSIRPHRLFPVGPMNAHGWIRGFVPWMRKGGRAVCSTAWIGFALSVKKFETGNLGLVASVKRQPHA